MVWTPRKKERGDVQRVDGLLTLEAGDGGKVFEVVMENVVTAEIFSAADELREIFVRGRLELLFRFDERPKS